MAIFIAFIPNPDVGLPTLLTLLTLFLLGSRINQNQFSIISSPAISSCMSKVDGLEVIAPSSNGRPQRN